MAGLPAIPFTSKDNEVTLPDVRGIESPQKIDVHAKDLYLSSSWKSCKIKSPRAELYVNFVLLFLGW